MFDVLILSSSALLLSNLILFTFGPYLPRRHAPLSIFLVMVVAGTSWALQQVLTGNILPITETLLVSVAFALILVRLLPDWNPAGHGAFGSTLAAVGSYLVYATATSSAAELEPTGHAIAGLLLVLQTATLLLLVGTMFETIDVICRRRWHGPGGRKSPAGSTPKVSIHVPIHAEPPEMVIETLNALSQVEYSNFEVLVIDNNTADETLWRPVATHCASLGERFRFFHLMPWPGFKSGALNYAMTQTASDAEIIAVVDADYIVEPSFLNALVGHFDDPKVAFVQTPQDYRDGQRRGRYGHALYRAYMYFFAVSMLSRNESNSIIYAGTMGLIRKSALVEVGGWDEWCITEDAELSLRLIAAGYDSVFVAETFGRGLMPLDLVGLKKQRFRWAFGGMQLLRMHFKTLVDPRSGLSFGQRFGYINGGLQWLNDFLAICYTLVLFVGALSLVFVGSLPAFGAAESLLLISPLFLILSIIRFLWAFRIQNGCSLREAADAASVLIGLTWVVGLACVRGLFSKQGIFLRTPKQAEQRSVIDAIQVVRAEATLAFLCLLGAASVLLTAGDGFGIIHAATVGLLVWQAVPFLAAVRLSIWSYSEGISSSGAFRTRTSADGQRTLGSWLHPAIYLSASIMVAATGYLCFVWQSDLQPPNALFSTFLAGGVL